MEGNNVLQVGFILLEVSPAPHRNKEGIGCINPGHNPIPSASRTPSHGDNDVLALVATPISPSFVYMVC